MKARDLEDRAEAAEAEVKAISTAFTGVALKLSEALASRDTYAARYKMLESPIPEVIEKAARIAETQVFYPDTKVGARQQWVRKEIARKIRGLKEPLKESDYR